MLSCKETSKLISEGLDHFLPFHKRLFIYIHLRACLTCGYYRQQIRALKKLFSSYPQAEQEDSPGAEVLSEEFRQQLKTALRQAGR